MIQIAVPTTCRFESHFTRDAAVPARPSNSHIIKGTPFEHFELTFNVITQFETPSTESKETAQVISPNRNTSQNA